jgi:signal peptidase I
LSEKNTYTEQANSEESIDKLNSDFVAPESDADSSSEQLYFKDEDSLSPNQIRVVNSEGALAGFYDWIKCILFAIAIVIVCLTFVFRLVDVDGSSMYDTLLSGDKVIVTNFMYEPEDGDIVVISHGAEYAKPIIKRVIATEGQTIQLDYENDRIIVDGVVLDEPYLDDSTFCDNIGDNEIPEVIPEGKIFVMGDNRRVSKDSRSTEIGLIEVENVIGKAQFVAFPFDNFGYLY